MLLLLLMLLLVGCVHHDYNLFSVARMQVFIDLEPIELQLIPKLLTLLVHDVGYALIAVFLLLDVFMLLFLIIVVW